MQEISQRRRWTEYDLVLARMYKSDIPIGTVTLAKVLRNYFRCPNDTVPIDRTIAVLHQLERKGLVVRYGQYTGAGLLLAYYWKLSFEGWVYATNQAAAGREGDPEALASPLPYDTAGAVERAAPAVERAPTGEADL